MKHGLSVLMVASLWGCTQENPPATFTSADSSGVRVSIVAAEGLESFPELAITVLLADTTSTVAPDLYRVSGVLPAPHGYIIADGGSGVVSLRTVDGSAGWSAGGIGNGPEEFGGLGRLFRGGDTIFVFDWARKRLQKLATQTGAYLSAVEIGAELPRASALGRFPDGSFLVQTTSGYPAREGPLAQLVTFLRLNADGKPGISLKDVQWTGMVGVRSPSTFSMVQIPLTTMPSAAIYGSSIALYTGSGTDVSTWSAEGELESIFRLRMPPIGRVPKELIEQEAGQSLEQYRARKSALRKHIPGSPPLFRRVAGDDYGRLWLNLFDPENPIGENWLVVDAAGEVWHRVRFPSGFIPLSFGDTVAGVAFDEFEEERLWVFGVGRAGSGSLSREVP